MLKNFVKIFPFIYMYTAPIGTNIRKILNDYWKLSVKRCDKKIPLKTQMHALNEKILSAKSDTQQRQRKNVYDSNGIRC